MIVSSTSPASIKPIFDTSVPTFTFNAKPRRKGETHIDVDVHIVYISQILRGGKEVRVKPLCVQNTESFFNGRMIAADKKISGLDRKGSAISFGVHVSKAPFFSAETKISL